MSEASWADALCKVIAERDALAKQLKDGHLGPKDASEFETYLGEYKKFDREMANKVREDALREAAEIASMCGVTPMTNVAHGGADWYRHGKEISRQILALIEEKTK